MDWLFRNRWPLAGSLVVTLALCAALVVWAGDAADESVTATGSSSLATDTTVTTPTSSTTTSTSSTSASSASPSTRSTTTRSTSTASTTTTTAAPTTTTPPSTAAPATTAPPATTSPATTAGSPPAPPGPEFGASIEPVTAAELGASWTPGRGCTPPEELRKVTVTHWGYDDRAHTGEVIVAASQAQNVVAIFGDIYAARFPIEQMVPVDHYGADDQASMRANNTSGYNCRTVAGSSTLSNHARGQAIDINPLHNPYVKGSTVDPPEGEPWADRSRQDPGMIRSGDAVVRAFQARGWSWGGHWSSPDYQHFDI